MPFLPPGDLPNPGIEHASPTLQLDSSPTELFFFFSTELLSKHGEQMEKEDSNERVTGRKARGLQTEETGCKCQKFLSLLSGRKKQTRDIFFFSIQI